MIATASYAKNMSLMMMGPLATIFLKSLIKRAELLRKSGKAGRAGVSKKIKGGVMRRAIYYSATKKDHEQMLHKIFPTRPIAI